MGVHVHKNGNRRYFLKTSALGAGLSLAGGCGTFSGSGLDKRAGKKNAGTTQPLKLPRFGFIGVGGIGRKHLQAFSALGVHVAALCDVDEQELYGAREMVRERFPSVRIYRDFRVMLSNTPGLDAVVISTPDHGHGLQAVHALRAGCHVFIETPLVHTLEELDLLEREAQRAKRIVLPGDCGVVHETALRACEVLRSGVLGRVLQIHIWTANPVWPQGGASPESSDPVPETLDWQLWLCGARPRSYKRFAYHRFNWRGWTDFGSGTLGDIGCRLLGFPFAALTLKAPHEMQRLFAAGGTRDSYPKATELILRCEAGVQKKPIDLFWYDGLRMPRTELLNQVKATLKDVPGTGTLICGERGSWFVSGTDCEQHYIGLNGGARMTALERHELADSVPVTLHRHGSPQERFLHLIRESGAYDFRADAFQALHRAVLCGAVLQRTGGKLEWSERKGRFLGSESANAMMKPHFEDGWKC